MTITPDLGFCVQSLFLLDAYFVCNEQSNSHLKGLCEQVHIDHVDFKFNHFSVSRREKYITDIR